MILLGAWTAWGTPIQAPDEKRTVAGFGNLRVGSFYNEPVIGTSPASSETRRGSLGTACQRQDPRKEERQNCRGGAGRRVN